MNNNLTLSVTLTGDGRQLSGTLQDARKDVREFGTETERESRKADTALTAPGRSAVTVSEHLRETQREARNFGTETVQSGRQATQALTQTADQTQTVNGYFSQMRTLVAGVGAALVGAFGANSVINRAGLINDADALATSIGIATSELQAWDYAAQRTGLSAGTIGDIFKDVSDKLGDFAATGGGEAADLFENLNLQVSELLRLSPDQQLLAIADALSSIEDPSQRVFYLESLANDATRLLPLLENNAAGLRTLTDEAYSLGVAMNQVDIDNALQADRAMAQLQGTVQGFLNLLAADLGPVMSETVGNFTNFIQEAGGADQVLSTLTDTALVLATLLAGRYVGAIAASQAALAAKNAVVATTTGALNVLTGATTRQAAAATAMAGATRVAHGALSLLGGPLGLLVGAGGLLYVFREDLGLVETGAENAATAIATSSAAIRDGSQAALESSYEGLTLELEAVSLKAQEAMTRLTELTARQRFYENSHEGMSASVSAAISQEEQVMAELWARQVQLQRAQRENREAKESLTSSTRQNSQETEISVLINRELAEANTEASKAADELAQSTHAQSDALDDLRNRLIPNRRETVQLARDVGTLTTAMAMGTGGVGQHIQSMQLLALEYISTQDETDELAKKTQDAAFTMEGAFDELRLNGLRRLDDGFADLWQGAIDGSLNASEIMKRVISQTLAEMAHMAITRPITVQPATSMGLGGGGQQASMGSSGGFGINPMSLGGAGQAFGNAFRAFQGTGSTYAGTFGAELAVQTEGGLRAGFNSFANSGFGSTALGVGGGFIGSKLGGAVFGESQEQQIGSALGGLAGQVLIPIPGLGAGIGSFLGSAVGSLFGSRKTPPQFELMTAAQGVDPTRHGLFENYGEGVYSQGALGTVGFYDPNTARLEETFDGFENAKAFLDQITAMDNALAGVSDSEQELSAMAAAAQAVRLNAADAAGIADQLASRTLAVVDVIDGDFSASLRGLGLDAEQITARVVDAATAMQLLDASSARLNLQFDATAEGALSAAGNLSSLVGGSDNLNSLFSGFYDAFYTQEEKFNDLADGLSSTFAEMGRELPTTREGVRELVEGLQLMGTAGQEQLATILQTTPALREYITAMEAQNSVVNDSAAIAAIAEEKWRLENDLLEAQGRDAELLARTRERELSSLDESNRALQERIWMFEDEKAAQDAAIAAQEAAQQRADLLNRTSLYSSGIVSSVEDALDAYNEQMQLASEVAQQREQQLQSEMQAVQQLGNLLDSLMLSNQSILDPAERLQEAQRQFADLQVRAEMGDTDAAGQLQGASSTYLDAAASYYGQSSSQYADIFNDVTGSVRDLEDSFGESIATLGSIEAIEQKILREQQAAVDTLRDSLGEYIEQSSLLGSIADLIELLPDSLGSVLAGLLPEEAPASEVGGGTGGGFNEAVYLANKTDHVNSIGHNGRSNWTPDQVLDVIVRDYGSVQHHYDQIGRSEGVQPYATGAWSIPGDQLAMIHDKEMVVPSRGGIADEFRAYAAGDYQAELMAGISDIQRALPMSLPNTPPMALGMSSRQSVNTPAPINLEPLTRELAALRLEVAQLRSERRRDAEHAAGQRSQQVREQRKGNRYTKTKVSTL